MITAESAIRSFRRNLTMSWVVKGALFSLALFSLLVGPVLDPRFHASFGLWAIAIVWIVLGYRSARGTSLAADSPSLIAAGEFEEAEHHIEQSLRSFSLFRTAKLLSLHHLALLRHAQRRWGDAALLCRALLGQRLGTLGGLSRQTLLILAHSQLEMGDLRGAHESLQALYSQRASLTEAMNLLMVQLDYESRVGAWSSMMQNASGKVQIAELMPAQAAAKTQATLALAARRTGRDDWAKWLIRRAELVGDIPALLVECPSLKELWNPTPAEA